MSEPTTVPDHSSRMAVQGIRVEVIRGPDQGRAHTADSNSITIGTAAGNDLRLSDETVSRYHVELTCRGDRIVVVDHGSTNGTAIGGAWITTGTVRPGTVLSLGRTSVRVDDSELVELEMLRANELADLRGRSPVMRTLMARIKRAAESDVSVLVLGETGAGKEVAARAIHELGARAGRPFETVDCGSLAPTLIASELFGHEKGAFTGADQQQAGAFERAHGGTLFLDEIGEIPVSLQATLLGAIERRSFRRIGGAAPIEVDVRIVSATNRDLRSEVNAGRFRPDLYYRLAVLPLQIPPLRDRLEDLPLLVEHFLHQAGYDSDVSAIIPAAVMDNLLQHRWPGNVRELRNFVDAALALDRAPDLELESIPRRDVPAIRFPTTPAERLVEMTFKRARASLLAEFEEMYVRELVKRCDGNVSQAARVSKIHRSYFNRMLQRHRIK